MTGYLAKGSVEIKAAKPNPPQIVSVKQEGDRIVVSVEAPEWLANGMAFNVTKVFAALTMHPLDGRKFPPEGTDGDWVREYSRGEYPSFTEPVGAPAKSGRVVDLVLAVPPKAMARGGEYGVVAWAE